MKCGILRFGTIAMQHNPESIVFSNRYSSGSFEASVNAKGEFFGEGCSSEAKLLELKFAKGESGLLSLPEMGSYYGTLSKLILEFTSVPNVVRYEFTFDIQKSPNEKVNIFYKADGTESLWDISRKAGCDVDEVIKLNKGIVKGIVPDAEEMVCIPVMNGGAVCD